MNVYCLRTIYVKNAKCTIKFVLRKLRKTLVLVIFSVYVIYNILFSLFSLEKVTVTEFLQ